MKLKRLLILALFFFLPAAASIPGRAYYAVSHLREGEFVSYFQVLLTPSILLCSLLLLLGLRGGMSLQTLPNRSLQHAYLAPLGLWFIAATVGFASHPITLDSVIAYVAGFLAAMLAYLSLLNVPKDAAFLDKIALAFTLGAWYPLVGGLLAFLLEWGLPQSGQALLQAHYNADRILDYQNATFGNVGNTAAFIVLLYPIVLSKCLLSENWKVRLLYLLTLGLIAANLLIVQSRAGFAVFYLATVLVLWFIRPGAKAAWAVLGFALSLAVIPNLLDAIAAIRLVGGESRQTLSEAMPHVPQSGGEKRTFAKRMLAALTLDQAHDRSVNERLSAMRAGWEIFTAHWTTGTGPGTSAHHNPFKTAHQFLLQQASELGLTGLIATAYLFLSVSLKVLSLSVQRMRSPANLPSFLFVMGPFCYLVYSMLANATLTLGVVNTWIVLLFAMLALSEAARRPTDEAPAAPPEPVRVALVPGHPFPSRISE